MKAIWNGEVIAETDDTVIVEGNHYFPESSLRSEFVSPSPEMSTCPWKGTASYYAVEVAGRRNEGVLRQILSESRPVQRIQIELVPVRSATIDYDQSRQAR